MGTDDFDESDDGEQPDDRSSTGFDLREGLRGLADLLRALDEVSDSRVSGRRSGSRADVDFDVSVRSGLGPGDRAGRPRRASPSLGSSDDQDDDYLVTAREEDDGIVVVADLPGVERDDVSIGLAEGDETLLVGVDDEVIERVSLPWPGRTADHSFSNGVLEVSVEEDT